MRRTATYVTGAVLILGVLGALLLTIDSDDSSQPEPDSGAVSPDERPERPSGLQKPQDVAGQARAPDTEPSPSSSPRDDAATASDSPSESVAADDGLCVVLGIVRSIDEEPLRARIECDDIYREKGSSTSTDDDGTFTLRLPPGDFRLTAYPERGRTAKCFLIIDEGESAKGVTIRVPRGFDLRGAVSDAATGLPIAGARLKTRHRVASTDSRGHYALGDMDPSVRLTVEASGYNPKWARLELKSHGAANFALRPAIEITGTVEDSSGSPIPGARVWSGEAQAVSDENGTFRLEDVAFNEEKLTARVAAEADDFAGKARAVYRIETPSHVRLVLFRGASVSGRVVDDAKQGVAGVQVAATRHWQASLTTRTDASGAFTISKIPEGRCAVSVSSKSMVTTAVAREFSLREGQNRTLAPFVVTKGVVVGGIVVDQAGNPAHGVDVITSFAGVPRKLARKLRCGQRNARTNREGRFVLHGLIPGPHTVTLISPYNDYVNVIKKRDPPRFLVSRDMPDLTFRMEKTHEGIAGTVRDADSGQAVQDFVVHLQRQAAESRAFSRKFTGTNGRFRLRKIPCGRYRVWVVTDGKHTSEVKIVELPYGRPAAKVNFLVARNR